MHYNNGPENQITVSNPFSEDEISAEDHAGGRITIDKARLARVDDEGGASAPTPHPPHSRPYRLAGEQFTEKSIMAVEDFQHKYHRRSIRLEGYDYSREGAYFVTIGLYGHEPYLEMPQVRAIMEETWRGLPQRFPTIELDEFVVMPDHVHFILWLHPDDQHRPTLGSIVGAYKSLTARAALTYLRTLGDICGDHFWHRDFYDLIIHGQEALLKIRTYIRNNPTKNDPLHHHL